MIITIQPKPAPEPRPKFKTYIDEELKPDRNRDNRLVEIIATAESLNLTARINQDPILTDVTELFYTIANPRLRRETIHVTRPNISELDD